MKNSSSGITLVEILVVVFIIGTFLMILVADFPKIQRQFALSRATYKFAQDLRRAQDMALSGVEIKKSGAAETIINAKGYGIYIDLISNEKEYIIYADIDNSKTYNAPDAPEKIYCDNFDPVVDAGMDCIVETIDLSKDAHGVIIKEINNTNNFNYISINFNPPNPTVSISGLEGGNRAWIVFALESDPINSTRNVFVWKSGLIEGRPPQN